MKIIQIFLIGSSLLAFSIQSLAQIPSMSNGEQSAPDQWLLSNGREWHHKTDVSPTPLELKPREPTQQEALLIKRAQGILQSSSTR